MNRVNAAFNSSKELEKALIDLKNNSCLDGVTVITHPASKNKQTMEESLGEDPFTNFSGISNQVVETAATAGRIVGSITGLAAVGLFSVPMLVMNSFLQGSSNSGQPQNQPSNRENNNQKQKVTVIVNSDPTEAENILVKNGAKIYPH